jgi:hypothetical protein
MSEVLAARIIPNTRGRLGIESLRLEQIAAANQAPHGGDSTATKLPARLIGPDARRSAAPTRSGDAAFDSGAEQLKGKIKGQLPCGAIVASRLEIS